MSLLIAGRMIARGNVARGWLEVDRAAVVAAGSDPPPRVPDLEHGGLIAPGLVDLQLNGAAGFEVGGGIDALERIERALVAHGVTSCLATLVTAEDESNAAAVAAVEERVADPASPIRGLHLEGPFLNPKHAGAHRAQLLRAPAEGVPAYYHSPAVRLVTLAPELDGALELIAAMRARGVAVALGHSGAGAAQARAAFEAGARIVTHLFNAMGQIHHREPGLAGAALLDERVSLGLIADGVHVVPDMLRLVHRLAADRVVLVSDASGTTLAGAPVARERDGTHRDAAGRLAGSAILLDEMTRRWSSYTGAQIAQAWSAASEAPAGALGLGPGLYAGGPADLVLLDDEGRVQRTMLGGRWVA